MDSMRSLNTSLPGTSPPKQQQQADNREDLLSAFRAAALSVTKLYKTATTEQGKARNDGYQDALDDLLLFLDKENIGLSDGEGWKIRRWATERLDGRSAPQTAESDEEVPDRASSRSPALSRSQQPARTQSIPRSIRTASPEQQHESNALSHNIPPVIEEEDEPIETTQITTFSVPSQSTFTFRAPQQYPQDADVIVSDLDSTPRDVPQRTSSSGTLSGSRVTNSSSRSNARRANGRGATTIGRGAGQKRKNNFDFSDFFGIDLGKDRQGGGGKRGRFA